MAKTTSPNTSQIVRPAPKPAVQPPSSKFVARPIRKPPHVQGWAPAWFYSALNWLGKTYYDAGNVRQSFSQYMAGSDVDPYAHLGSTRLFMIFKFGDTFELTLAADATSIAPKSGGTRYPNTDDGIRQMYIALSNSSIFSVVKYCYIPGQVGPDLNPNQAFGTFEPSVSGLQAGYDPATGLRTLVLGSAVSQVVPLDEFIKTHNEQIYDDTPSIVPLVTALVYDVIHYNTLGATTFVLPVYYTRDQVSLGNYYVNKLGSVTSLTDANVNYGQTVLFAGGPGYNDAAAAALVLKASVTAAAPDHNFTTYTFDKATVTTVSTVGDRVQTGVMLLTYSSSSPLSVFSNQRIIGFYRDASWKTCLGVPIYDFGQQNASFTATSVAPVTPVLIYDPTHPFLNGGSLQNVIRKLLQATYVYPADRLVSILDTAIAAENSSFGVGLSVMTAALDFNLSSPSLGPILDELTVPVLATVTTTPQPSGPPLSSAQVINPVQKSVAPSAIASGKATFAASVVPASPNAAASQREISVTGTNIVSQINPEQLIGSGANIPILPQPLPVTIQVGLNASVPREALSGTGITSIEIGTSFAEQPLGSGNTVQSATAGTVLNLMDRHGSVSAFPPYDLPTANSGVTFKAGIYYVLSLTGASLQVRGSDGSSASRTLAPSAAADPNHTFVGAMVYAASTTSVRLYPKLQLALPAPAVGTHGVLQGEHYSVRLTFGDASSQYDILDSSQAVVDSNISVPNPKPTDKSNPQQGDIYFGSFIGGSSQMTVWSAPVFLTVLPSQLHGAGFNGTMTLDSQVSGIPQYQLQITDSSLFIYSNVNVDTGLIGSVSSANVFLASAVINSAPDDQTSKAFAPCKVLLGLVRQAQMGTTLKYVFVPEDDSVVIGNTRYMLSVINLDTLNFNPNLRPYPPVFWPQIRYWQFANRHNPYIDVRYTGSTQQDRVGQAQADTARIGAQVAQVQEPMQLFLDTNPDQMTVWPIYGFPSATPTQAVDQGQLKVITQTILSLINTNFPAKTQPKKAHKSVGGVQQLVNPDYQIVVPVGQLDAPESVDAEQITIPDALKQNNPYTFNVDPAAGAGLTVSESLAVQDAAFSLSGLEVTNLSPGFIANTSVQGIQAQQSLQLQKSQKAAADLAVAKSRAPMMAVTQSLTAATQKKTDAALHPGYQSIYGFSVYNPGRGEAYIIELVNADQHIPDQLPQPTKYANYDPYYVRVVFLNTLTCYNMSIIVPTMVHDQYGHFSRQGTEYQNLFGQTDELELGYMYSLSNADNIFDNLNFGPYPDPSVQLFPSQTYTFTNIPYSIGAFSDPLSTPPAYFVCRRKNWNADCHLMQTTRPSGSAIYLAFGAGDLVPLRLDAKFIVDKRHPAHMYKLTHMFADQQYDSAQTISVGNQPYVVAVATQTTPQGGSVTRYMNFSINATSGTADLQIGPNLPLQFPTECYVVGQASTTLTTVSSIDSSLADTGDFMSLDDAEKSAIQQFQLIAYNNLVYLIRAVANVPALGKLGGLNVVSGLLIDTYAPTTTGNLALAQGARYKRSGLPFFGSTYTPSTMVDTLDTLDFTSITGDTFFVPTIFIPIAEIDANKGFVANLSNFFGQQIWTLIYPEIVAQKGATVNSVTRANGFNIDADSKPILSVQKLHFVYDPLAVLFTPNDVTHKYPLQPKQQILALTNGQIQEGICWRSANVQPQRLPPTNICAQKILPAGVGMDRPNIIYSSQNTPVITPISSAYRGMSVNSVLGLSGVVYNIEESALSTALANDQTVSGFISAVSSVSNMLVGVLFDYDNNDRGTLSSYDVAGSTKGLVFLNGYLGAAGYSFSSPDHFDVNDVLPSQLPVLEQIANVLGFDVSVFNIDISLPQQYWSLVYDTFTAAGLPNYIPNVPPSVADPTFSNRTRSLILSLQNPVQPNTQFPDQLGLMDTYSSVVSANLHLSNGVTGSIFLSKKAERDVASIGAIPRPTGLVALFGLSPKYDFFIFSRDHYSTLEGASFELIDQGYAMCLVDDGSGTGTKVAKYYIDSDGNYNELYTYVLYSPSGGVIESASFILKVTLGAPANLAATPVTPETPNNVNPQDLVAQINKVSNLVYAAFGPSTSGQPPAFIPIQAVGGKGVAIEADPIIGPPGFNGYTINVAAANRQPVQISQIYSGPLTYAIAGPTTILPINPKTGKAVPFYGSLSHGLDKQLSGIGGNGLGALIATPLSCSFQGSSPIPAAGTIMKADGVPIVPYTFNAVTSTVMDPTGKPATVSGGQYFIDATDPANPIFAVVTLPKFTLNGNTYAINLSTTVGGVSRYTLIVGGKSYQFDSANTTVTVDLTTFTFNGFDKGKGAYTVTYTAKDDPTGNQVPSPITLTPFSIAAGGGVATIDVFNSPAGLTKMILGVIGRQYTYDPIGATVTIYQGATTATAPLATGLTFTSNSNYGYVIGTSNGSYTVNGSPMIPYSAVTMGAPASYSLMTAPKMFTIGGNFYVFDQDVSGNYLSVTGNGQTYPVNPYQFSINGIVYIVNTNVQPNTVVGGGNVYAMTANNNQFILNGVQYTITLKQNSLNGATVSGQFNITQGNVVGVENYVYQLDTLNGRIVGNGTAYPLTTSGFTCTITTADRSFTVTTQPNATTVTIGTINYLINNTTVVGDGVTYPILAYRTFLDGAAKFVVGLDGTVSTPPPFTLSGSAPYFQSTFADAVSYTVNDIAAFDGVKNYYLMSGSPGSPLQFTTPALTYAIRTDGIAIAAGGTQTYIVNTSGPLSPHQFTFGTKTIFFGRSSDAAAFDGTNYYAISNGQFKDTNTNRTYTLSGNTAVNEGNSYEIFSNLGQGSHFQVPGGPTYYVNVNVADLGTASGDIFSVFPIAGSQFIIPLLYTITISGSTVSVNAITFTAGATAIATLTGSGGSLTGGFFVDPVTKISYTCVVNGASITFVDSNNAVYTVSGSGPTYTFKTAVVVVTGVHLAVDNQAAPAVYALTSNNSQFVVGTTTYTVNVPVAYQTANAATGPYWQMTNGRFIVPRTAPLSNVTYTVKGGNVVKGYVVSADDEFSVDGNVVYTVNAVNVTRATNQAALDVAGQTLTSGPYTYKLDAINSVASIQPAGLNYNTASKQFTVSYSGSAVTYTVGASTVTDNRPPKANTFPATVAASQITFTDTVSGVTFTFDSSGNNPITAEFVYTNQFFLDAIAGTTYYIDVTDKKVEAISYLPETTQYAFTPADGNTYLIHYNNVGVVFPVVSGANVNAGVATVGSDIFTVNIDEVDSTGGGAIPVNRNSFEVNGNLYTIRPIPGTPNGADYSPCTVVGDGITPKPITYSGNVNTFKLNDPTVTYTLQLDSANLPAAVVAAFAVQPSRDLLNINDYVYIITYNTVSAGSLLGQGNPLIPINNSSFTLTNLLDSTKAKFIFADLNIYDSASVIGQFGVYLAPTFFLGNATYTLDAVNQVVTDDDERPFPELPNPMMFSINGFNYVIDTNRVPHAIVGNNNVSPLATDVTVESGQSIPNSTFTLNGLIYKYTEDPVSHNLLTITGTQSYMIAQPALTFKLDSSLIFTINPTPPGGGFAGTVAPIGTITAGTSVTLNLYPGTPESGGADFFTYKNVLYTLVKSGSVYVSIQKSYTVYMAKPAVGQQQLAVFDLNGVTYLLTDGTTAGTKPPAGINPNTMWAATGITKSGEQQFGLVCGFTPQPISVSQSPAGVFQFQVTDANSHITLYDILFTTAGNNINMVKVDVPNQIPTFTQSWQFNFIPTANYAPLTFETGGYNAFTLPTEMANPIPGFAGAYRAPVTSTDAQVDSLIGPQGDFSLEFWHSIPLTIPDEYHLLTYTASTNVTVAGGAVAPLVYDVDVDFQNKSTIFVRINNTVLKTVTTPPVFSSGWRHFALTYTQPYNMLLQGGAFEVKDASNYDFDRDFSIAMTFNVSDISSDQGLLYKGTGSATPSPQLNMSYSVAVINGMVTLTLIDSTLGVNVFQGPAIQANQDFQVIIVKHTNTLAGTPADSSTPADPYAPPLNLGDMADANSKGAIMDTDGVPSAKGQIKFSNVQPQSGKLSAFQTKLQTQAAANLQSYNVVISVRTVNNDGTFGSPGTPWTVVGMQSNPGSDATVAVNSTGSAHLLIGSGYDANGQEVLLGSFPGSAGTIRSVHLFNTAINPIGIQTATKVVSIENASADDLKKAGLVGFWIAQYDPNGVVNNPIDQTAVAIPTGPGLAYLAPLTGREFEGSSLFINGAQMNLTVVTGTDIPASMPAYSIGSSLLKFNAGVYKLEEISIWQMARQPYQIIDDMFGRLIPSNEPFLAVYLSGSFPLPTPPGTPPPPPYLPMSQYIDNRPVSNAGTLQQLTFSAASLDLQGCPAVAVCGPLVTPNLYTPPAVALTVCDTAPDLTTYSVTINDVSGTLAGEINEAYVYITNGVLTLYAGKKIGDLVLTWVSQEQGDVQLIGYIEGAPPCPMANMTNKPATTFLEPTTIYSGATSITFTTPTSMTLKYQQGEDTSTEIKSSLAISGGIKVGLGLELAPIGFGPHMDKDSVLTLDLGFGGSGSTAKSDGNGWKEIATEKLDESKKYTLKMQGTLAPYTGDQFMGSLNTLTTPSTTPGASSSKTAILPNPNLGGFTTSNPPAPLPKAPTEEKFGSRMYIPSPYGQAFVTSQTLDVYQQTLLQTKTVFGFVRIPNAQIPRDLNIISFRMSSKYIRPGCIDGVVGYIYNPATLPNGTQTYATSTGQMQALYDGNFSPGEVGHDASYMRVVEAYRLKRQIDQQAFNAIALYQTVFNRKDKPNDSRLTPGLDFYNEYVWSSRGGTQEVKHSYTTSYNEVYTASKAHTIAGEVSFNIKLIAATVCAADTKFASGIKLKDTIKASLDTTGSSSFDVTAAFDGIETDTQMRYACNNDAHFVMNNNSMFNPNNQSGLNLVIGSDGLVYKIVPSVSSGAGIPVSDNNDNSQPYTQPQPTYTSGNADGLMGNLESYDRPGKTKLFRTYTFFLQPKQENADDFWNTVVDPVWLKNSSETDADALRKANKNASLPWRLLYRVTYSERFLPPVSNAAIVVPNITPIMAVPVLNAASDFLFKDVSLLPRPALNPNNDIEANVVLAAPTASGKSAAAVGSTVLPNNVIPFDLVKGVTSVVNWGDSANAGLLTQLITSVLGLNTVPMSASVLSGSTKVTDVLDPASGGPLYTIYTDPNGLAVNVPARSGIIVYQDVNSNPIQYFDGKAYHSLQADYVASSDGTIMYYIQPPSTYDQTKFDLVGDYDLFGHPGDEWRYYLVSGMSANMTSEPTVAGFAPFVPSTGAGSYTGFSVASPQKGAALQQVKGYVLVQGTLQWPHLNTNAETLADVQVYKSMSLLDTFPIGDPETLISFLTAQYPGAPFVANDEINLVFAKNIVSYFNSLQQALIPE